MSDSVQAEAPISVPEIARDVRGLVIATGLLRRAVSNIQNDVLELQARIAALEESRDLSSTEI